VSGFGAIDELQRSARADRLRARAPRYLFIALVVILSLAGLKSILSSDGAAPAAAAGDALVDQAEEDFALRFARAYLTYDVANPDLRERALRSYVPQELDSDAGMVPARGSQSVEWMQVAQHQEALAGGVVIVVAAQLDTRKEPLYLAVPVQRRPDDALQLVTYPSLVGGPTISSAPAPTFEEVDDTQVSTVAERVIRNYLAGEGSNLDADLAPDAVISLPAEPMKVQSVDDVTWATDPSNPAVMVTVEATDSSRALWTLTYEVGIDQSTGRTLATYVETVPNAT
jgi:hypothetical protein